MTLIRGTQSPWRVTTMGQGHVPSLCSPPFAVAGQGVSAAGAGLQPDGLSEHSGGKRKRNFGEGMKAHQETTNGFGHRAKSNAGGRVPSGYVQFLRSSDFCYHALCPTDPRAPRRARPRVP